VLDVTGALPWTGEKAALRLRVTEDAVETVSRDRRGNHKTRPLGRPDQLSLIRARALARQLAPYRIAVASEAKDSLGKDIDLLDLLGAPGDAADFDPVPLWAGGSTWDHLRVPIGVTDRGEPLELDLKESALGGMGPHGILIGATGSGKSETIRTLVLALAMSHSSEKLNMVLVDFKGGATFLGLEHLPHVSAFITNLADELPLVDRMQDALQGELIRRQELLRAAGYSSIHDYEKARANGAELAPLPTLVIIVDEFGELLATKSEFMDLFVMIGRLGRSLGVHLLLASQRLEEGRISSLETHLSYRLGLRVFFRTRWAAHNVRLHRTGLKHFHHPVVGDLHLTFDAFEMPAEQGLTMSVYSAEPGSATDDALRLLASWSATDQQTEPSHVADRA
jgi:S-DNA-T family DNA segregation ATPase FtsK/SpoIIIE